MSRRTASRGKADLPTEPIPPAVVFSPPTAPPPRPLPLRATAAAAAAAGGGEVPLSAAAEEALAAAAGGASVNEGSQPAAPPETPACAVARRLSSPPSVSKRQAAQRSPPQARLDPPVAHPLTGIALLDSLSQQANRALEPSQKKARNRLRYPEPPNARSGGAAAAAGCPPAALPSSRRVAREGQQPRRRAGQQQLPPPPPPASVQLHFAAHPFPPLRQEAVRLLDTALFAAVRGELTTQEASTHATVPSQCAIPLHSQASSPPQPPPTITRARFAPASRLISPHLPASPQIPPISRIQAAVANLPTSPRISPDPPISRIQAAVASVHPAAAVFCYGSRATGLASAASDVDLVAGGPHAPPQPH